MSSAHLQNIGARPRCSVSPMKREQRSLGNQTRALFSGWHSSVDGFVEPPVPPTKSASRHSLPRCRNSFTSTEELPHIGNYRLLKTIGKGNFAKVKLARHVLTGREDLVLRYNSSLQLTEIMTLRSSKKSSGGNQAVGEHVKLSGTRVKL
ncbi:Serine/threonine-protein kinase MARK1 [Liparis tanakae]|uniref:Serine/threonine-protein kinase MARK1 n=1 Tax=Liparis tanakae TaxID=230148 RepID=A0A4Z2GDX8_9TELE|nr:Serine/threonine-protein kinase MARK1 [Liparis tanakae]